MARIIIRHESTWNASIMHVTGLHDYPVAWPHSNSFSFPLVDQTQYMNNIYERTVVYERDKFWREPDHVLRLTNRAY